MAKLIIFGAGQIAELAHYYFTGDSDHEVVAFTVDRAYKKEDTFLNLPLVSFEEIEEAYPAQSCKMFLAISYTGINKARSEKFFEAGSKGYDMVSYVSSKATVFDNVSIGSNCFILEDNTLQPFVRIGDNVTLWSGNHIGHHSVIEDHCFISSHVVVSGNVHIEPYCFLGVNATIRNNIRISRECVIGAGALILGNTEERGVYISQAAQLSPVPSNRLKNL